ncbi:hypothetical protein ABT104_23715 [Streptomyces mobaraensis]|uniref:hypothetical protein n=1 Tax=Streptomyces mobaraensis TaxID=35621 RepID=UPI003325DAD7
MEINLRRVVFPMLSLLSALPFFMPGRCGFETELARRAHDLGAPVTDGFTEGGPGQSPG